MNCSQAILKIHLKCILAGQLLSRISSLDGRDKAEEAKEEKREKSKTENKSSNIKCFLYITEIRAQYLLLDSDSVTGKELSSVTFLKAAP